MIYGIPLIADVTIGSLIASVNKVVINPLIIFLFSLALIMFMFGMVKFIANRESGSDKASDGKRNMFWGVVGMAIMMSVFGIMNFIANTLGIEGDIQINTEQGIEIE